MIIGIGIDSVEIERFAQWHIYSDKKLNRIFSPQEIEYCRSNILLSAQRFAVRFAAREALFKAISQACPGHTIPFLTLCRAVTISKNRAPILHINGELFTGYGIRKSLTHSQPLISLTHTQNIATAFVILAQC